MTSSRLTVRWVAAALAGLYAVVIARLTLAPASSESGIFARLDYWATRLSGGHLDWARTEVLANVALFMPAGFLVAVALGRVWASVVLCVAVSALIELSQAQFFPSRAPSVDDVLHNGIGGLLGALVAWPVAAWIRSRPAVASTHRAPAGV